jgi:hypothetical protein
MGTLITNEFNDGRGRFGLSSNIALNYTLCVVELQLVGKISCQQSHLLCSHSVRQLTGDEFSNLSCRRTGNLGLFS